MNLEYLRERIGPYVETFALKLLRWVRPGTAAPAIPRGSCGVSVGPRGVNYFGPEEYDWDENTGAYAVLSMGLLILVRDADLDRSICEAIVQAAIELGLGQEKGEELALAFRKKESLTLAA